MSGLLAARLPPGIPIRCLTKQTLKGEINQIPYEMPLELRQAIESFVEYYNHRCYLLARASIFPMIKNEVRSVGTA